jgi:hypothetical protein
MDFLIFLKCFSLIRGGEGNTKPSIAIAALILVCNKFMECQYGKGDIFSFDLYKSCTQLKVQFARYRKMFEHLLRSLVFTFCILPVNEE